MTVDEAVAKAATKLDEITARVLSDVEAMLKNRGATDEELRLELERTREEIAAFRHRALQEARAFIETAGANSSIH
jgi:hypothetical protein